MHGLSQFVKKNTRSDLKFYHRSVPKESVNRSFLFIRWRFAAKVQASNGETAGGGSKRDAATFCVSAIRLSDPSFAEDKTVAWIFWM